MYVLQPTLKPTLCFETCVLCPTLPFTMHICCDLLGLFTMRMCCDRLYLFTIRMCCNPISNVLSVLKRMCCVLLCLFSIHMCCDLLGLFTIRICCDRRCQFLIHMCCTPLSNRLCFKTYVLCPTLSVFAIHVL